MLARKLKINLNHFEHQQRCAIMKCIFKIKSRNKEKYREIFVRKKDPYYT